MFQWITKFGRFLQFQLNYNTLQDKAKISDEMWEILFEDDGTHYESKTAHGIVTEVRDSQGIAIIDHEIYMDLSLPVTGGGRIRVNDNLVMVVKRRSIDDAWRVERVEMVERHNYWDLMSSIINVGDGGNDRITAGFPEKPDHFTEKVVIGMVTEVLPNELVINNGETVISQSEVKKWKYCVGDWLSMIVLFDPESSNSSKKCINVEPLRQWHCQGVITHLFENTGIIEENIFFKLTACSHGYTPNLKDEVLVTAIESSAGGQDITWRAVNVSPNSKEILTNFHSMLNKPDYKDLLKDKNDIILEGDTNFGHMTIGSVKNLHLKIRNIDFKDQVLVDATFHNQSSNFLLPNITFPVTVPTKSEILLQISFRASTMGVLEDILELNFGEFLIGRSLSVEVSCSDEAASPIKNLKRNGSFGNRFQILQAECEKESQWILKGVRPYKQAPFAPYRLGSYPVPRYMWRSLSERNDLTQRHPCLAHHLSPSNYKEKFSIILHIEEVEMSVRIRQYDIDRTSLKHLGPYLQLEVEGLTEKRPSLIPGDSVILSNPWGGDDLKYEGFVHQTLKSSVLLQFHPEFHSKYADEDYAVSFQLNRTSLRRCHAAVEMAIKQPGFDVLFPKSLKESVPQIVKEIVTQTSGFDQVSQKNLVNHGIDWVNPSLNEEQRNAVSRILEGVCRPIPYIIYGPPGTGKTVTIVEAILQVFLSCSRSRILVATPSNSSADLITERLHQSQRVKTGDMVRLMAFNRSIDLVPEAAQPYCMTSNQLEQAVRHRIVVSTCANSGNIYALGLKRGHFTHVFIDEAGQATEPECLLTIGLLHRDSEPGQIILAGDPKQLGPVLVSIYAAEYGLGLSLLERLSLNPLYSRTESHENSLNYNPKLLTKLVRNYRSHPALLTIPSQMFYENELTSFACTKTVGHLSDISWLPKLGIPIVFHGVRGENFQESDSPSWFNPAEVYHVARYFQMLLNHGIVSENIGIIAPYRKQVEKIRQFIQINGLAPVKVGSVEEFQGQERDAIIVSTTRSNGSLVDSDILHHLGFIRSPKRFNVTVTRAKSLLIVVGNPHLLVHDENWGTYLKYCVKIGCYTGCDLPFIP